MSRRWHSLAVYYFTINRTSALRTAGKPPEVWLSWIAIVKRVPDALMVFGDGVDFQNLLWQ